MYFQNYGLLKTLIDLCLKTPFSEDPFTGNMVIGPKRCFNLSDSMVTIFSNHFVGS